MNQVNASWDNPEPFIHLDDFTRKEMIRVCEKHLQGFQRHKYLGRKQFFKYKNIKDLDILWGWKDPRNSFTWDVWKEIFPHAKIIHIYRNPVDIAASLRKREQHFESHMQMHWTGYVNECLLRSVSSFAHAVRVADIREGVKLWEEYVSQSFNVGRDFDVLNIRYESFLEEPQEYLSKVLQFIDLEPSNPSLAEVTSKIDKSRQFAFLENDELTKLYLELKQNNPLFEKCDYMNIVS